MRLDRGIIFFAGIFFFTFQGCSGNSENLSGEKDSSAAIIRDTVTGTWNLLKCDSIPENTMLILEGYIGNPGEQIIQSGSYITLPFFERRNQRAGYFLNLQFQAGNLPNQMQELPDQFKAEDVKILCETGDVAGIGSFVRITAFDERVNGVRNWKVNLIEQGDFISDERHFETARALTSEIISDSAITELYSYIEGKLEIPELILPYTDGITLTFTNGSIEEMKNIEIPIGLGASTMNDLPDNFTEADLIVRDFEGKNIPYNKKVRIYGNWTRFSYSSSFPGEFVMEEIEVVGK